MKTQNTPGLISHAAEEVNLESEVKRIKTNIEALDADEEHKSKLLNLVEALQEFELGKFLICNKGLNGYWTSYVVRYPESQVKAANSLEQWLLESCPALVATQQRFKIFQQILSSTLKDGMKLASIPCGLMDDVLRLDLNKFKDLELMGVDLDQDSLIQAEALAKNLNVEKHCSFHNYDAWQLPWNNELDILVSNGLNIYVHNDDMLEKLYESFYRAIKPDGMLLASFVTPPPSMDANSPWMISNMKAEDLMQQALVFSILEVQWQSFKTESFTI